MLGSTPILTEAYLLVVKTPKAVRQERPDGDRRRVRQRALGEQGLEDRRPQGGRASRRPGRVHHRDDPCGRRHDRHRVVPDPPRQGGLRARVPDRRERARQGDAVHLDRAQLQVRLASAKVSARLASAASLLALAAVAGGAIVGAAAAVPRWKAWLCKPGLTINYCNTYLSVTAYASDGVKSVIRCSRHPAPAARLLLRLPDREPGEARQRDLKIQTAESAARDHAGGAVLPRLPGLRAGVPADDRLRRPEREQRARLRRRARCMARLPRPLQRRPRRRPDRPLAGSVMLEQLIQKQIEPRSEQRLLVSAILLGGDVVVGTARRGRFTSLPACSAARRPAASSPTRPGAALLRRTPTRSASRGPSEHVLCVNPAARTSSGAARSRRSSSARCPRASCRDHRQPRHLFVSFRGSTPPAAWSRASGPGCWSAGSTLPATCGRRCRRSSGRARAPRRRREHRAREPRRARPAQSRAWSASH